LVLVGRAARDELVGRGARDELVGRAARDGRERAAEDLVAVALAFVARVFVPVGSVATWLAVSGGASGVTASRAATSGVAASRAATSGVAASRAATRAGRLSLRRCGRERGRALSRSEGRSSVIELQ
jgi:hypothetical protein